MDHVRANRLDDDPFNRFIQPPSTVNLSLKAVSPDMLGETYRASVLPRPVSLAAKIVSSPPLRSDWWFSRRNVELLEKGLDRFIGPHEHQSLFTSQFPLWVDNARDR